MIVKFTLPINCLCFTFHKFTCHFAPAGFSTSTCKPARHLKVSLITLLLCFLSMACFATPGSGTVYNHYVAVTNINPTCQPQITIGALSSYPDNIHFMPNQRVLIIQMKGATISGLNDPTYGDITNKGSAGNFEFATIINRVGDVVTFSQKLKNFYSIFDKVQLVTVSSLPVYSSALSCAPWNGTLGIGGVLVLENTQSITIGGDINVDELGFAGGIVSNLHNGLYGILDYIPTSSSTPGIDYGGGKGEGICDIAPPLNFMRGKAANGGGGGNEMNAGGGGGSNFGYGGKGGFELASGNDLGGIGGAPLGTIIGLAEKVFMGGGGGGGHQGDINVPQTSDATPGGNGGGIVIIKTPVLNASSALSITANGASALPAGALRGSPGGGDDGAGGGGAGGTVLLYVNSYGNNFSVSANGGNGGDNPAQYPCHAPGGGGGGGFIGYSSLAPFSMTVNGGAAGAGPSAIGSSCGNYGATAGFNGGTLVGIIPLQSPPSNQTICAGRQWHQLLMVSHRHAQLQHLQRSFSKSAHYHYLYGYRKLCRMQQCQHCYSHGINQCTCYYYKRYCLLGKPYPAHRECTGYDSLPMV